MEERFWGLLRKLDCAGIEKMLAVKKSLVESLGTLDGVRWMPLHYASAKGQEDLVELMIRKYSAPVDARNNGQTALMVACMHSHKRVMERLLLAGANANLQCEHTGNTALHFLALG